MAFKRDPEGGRKAAVWLAVAFTMTVGAAVCSFIILTFADHPRQAFLVLGGILGMILFMLWSMSSPRDKSESKNWLQFWRSTREQPDAAEMYEPHRRQRAKKTYGNNQPPTLEKIREISETHARWVPHGPVPRRDRPDRP